MRIRLKTNWNNKEREVSLADSVGVLAYNGWKIGMQTLLEIENENFQTDTQLQRIDVLEEIMAFLVHILDRISHNVLSDDDRAELLNAFALKLADHVQDNKRDFAGAGDHRNPFINKLNQRLMDYTDTTWSPIAQEPGFSMSLQFANHVSAALGPRDQKWAVDYIQRVLLPEMLRPYKQVMTRLGFLPSAA